MTEQDSKKTIGQLYAVTLKYGNQTYYLVDLKFTISLCKGSAMLFTDENHALDFATRIENWFSTHLGAEVLGSTIRLNHINEL